jgi:hypothetical protein
VYDMYPWNEPGSGASHHQDETAAAWLPAPRNGTAPRNGNRHANGNRHPDGDTAPADFTQAIQFALDRRDNGGDAVAASQPATPPTAGLTRQ